MPPASNDPPSPPVMSVLELAAERLWRGLYLLCVVALFVVLFFYTSIFVSIGPGQAGVRWRRIPGLLAPAGIEERIYGEGLQVIYPWDRIDIYDTRIQETNIKVGVYSKDGMEVSVNVSVRFRPIYDQLPQLHREVGPDYIDKLVRPEIISTLRKVIGNYRPEEIYARDEQGLLTELQATMEADFDSQYITLDKFLIEELLMPEHIQNAIQDKLEQEQKAKAYYYIIERERYEHERRIIEATGIRDFQEVAGIPILQWRGIEATEAIAKSPNAKIVIMGSSGEQLPVILNTASNEAVASTTSALPPELQAAFADPPPEPPVEER